MTDDLVAWLEQQLDADEELDCHLIGCQKLKPRDWSAWMGATMTCDCGMPARMLAEVAAKRAVLEMLRRAQDGAEDYRAAVLYEVVHALAQPYAGRPGWRPEWAAEVTT